MEDFLPRVAWPQEVFAIDAPGADPAQRDARAAEALAALTRLTDARLEAVNAPAALVEGQAAPTHAQRVQRAIDQIKLLLGKDFPVLPQFSLGPYAAEFSASLAEQDKLTVGDPWRSRAGSRSSHACAKALIVSRLALSAHEALIDVSWRGRLQARAVSAPVGAGVGRAARSVAGGCRCSSSTRRRCPKSCTRISPRNRARRTGDPSCGARTWRSRCMRPADSMRSRRTPPSRVSRRRMGRVHSRPVPDGGHRLSLRCAGRASATEHHRGAAAADESGELDVR